MKMKMNGEMDLCGGGDGGDKSCEIHQVPCCIKYNGPSPVSHYFKPKPTGVSLDGLPVKEAHFRGRKLQGTTPTLPNGYSGFVIGKITTSAKRKASSSSWQSKARFQNITVWNHDNMPSKEDAFSRAFHWFHVAKALHKPVTPADMESATD